MKKILEIRGVKFELPNNVEFKKEESGDTHIYFDQDDENSFKAFLFDIMTTFKIQRFGHDLGIVFSGSHIFSYGDFPVDVRYYEE